MLGPHKKMTPALKARGVGKGRRAKQQTHLEFCWSLANIHYQTVPRNDPFRGAMIRHSSYPKTGFARQQTEAESGTRALLNAFAAGVTAVHRRFLSPY